MAAVRGVSQSNRGNVIFSAIKCDGSLNWGRSQDRVEALRQTDLETRCSWKEFSGLVPFIQITSLHSENQYLKRLNDFLGEIYWMNLILNFSESTVRRHSPTKSESTREISRINSAF